jgi:hypothetical protein
MPEYGNSGCEPSPIEQDEWIFDASLERIQQHGPGITLALGLLETAQDMDNLLRHEEKLHPLSRRFVISSAGSENYPFPHERIELQPKSSVMNRAGFMGLMLRFGIKNNPDNSMVFSGAVTITYLMHGYSTADYVLTDESWDPYVDAKDLKIENGILLGAINPSEESSFRIEEFKAVLEDMEPALQTNTTAP